MDVAGLAEAGPGSATPGYRRWVAAIADFARCVSSGTLVCERELRSLRFRAGLHRAAVKSECGPKSPGRAAEILREEQYFALQLLDEFDPKTSLRLLTPPEIRQLGGAIYGDRRYNRVFIGHNGVDSCYRGRGFRCGLRG